MDSQSVVQRLVADGFAIVREPELTSSLLGLAAEFFSIPLADRLKLICVDGARGYAPSECEFAQAVERGLLREDDRRRILPRNPRGYSSFDFGPEDPVGDARLYGPNQFPAGPIAENIRSSFESLMSFSRPVAVGLFEVLNNAELDTGELHATTRLLHYPSATEQWSKEHTDFELFAIIAASRPGLELWIDGEWFQPAIGPDEVVFVLGECAELLSSGQIPAIKHRVALDQERFAVPFFQGLCAETLVNDSGLSYADHMAAHYSRTYPHIGIS